tara:strand:+ start:46974 stop:48002 length:1029 start_codon:yes stop_codon:yes gene_type:complete
MTRSAPEPNPRWKPGCSLGAIKARAEVYASIRAFFDARNVLEVETPLLSRSTATDPCLDSISSALTVAPGLDSQHYYLQTSPEFPMKRLLASGSGSIYQICKAFRNAETGNRHNPEFTMLEWYRLNFSLNHLMAEVEELVSLVLNQSYETFEKISYREAFQLYLGINPFTASSDELVRLASQKAGFSASPETLPELSRDDYLNVLLSICVEPNLGQCDGEQLKPVFLYAYPPSHASLAKLTVDDVGERVAERFELYINGLEIANGYFELTDAQEQRRRFEEDNIQRIRLGLPAIPVDENLLSALKEGMPECSGVALGLDRLLMIKLQAARIEEVISFPITRA